ncbi:fructosamine kinase family protein [Galbibacter sp. BG1]|uniref:fructosamine kinase family protein n=1 Tax=Galbibacter sp. BG1 TaxID=1170699 RepID=UPI0015BD1705|nr:fructosamine kinase family protein [Galbibacter sp. BG1]QLE01618.1 fructosamine kinase family protein [Galbibacter sp. BG1]
MVNRKLKTYLTNYFKTTHLQLSPLSGGDINEVYRIDTNTDSFVIKVNDSHKGPRMFAAEANGLTALKNAQAFKVPEVIEIGTIGNLSFLILQFIPSGKKNTSFWSKFGEQLAIMHQNSKPYYGFGEDNYIGSLPQFNTTCKSSFHFYQSQRLEPQLRMAKDNGYSFSNIQSFYKTLENIIPEEPSALIHGDLWSGNFMVNTSGDPCLIDPAISYAPREMDISMMHLFGGFPSEVFQVYNELFPLQEGWKERIELWQLYYLLVHLNLFGTSYLGSVKRILNKYA